MNKFVFLLTTLATLTFNSASLASSKTASDALEAFAWEKRQLIVFTNSETHPQYLEFLKAKQSFQALFDDRKLHVWHIIKGQKPKLESQTRADLNATDFNKTYGVSENEFKVLLIGYDQGVKVRQDKVNVDYLFSEIDQMPMRIQEMESAKKISETKMKNSCPATLNFDMRPLAKNDKINLCERYKNKVVLIVNTASKCGFTGQFDGLEKLYQKYKDKGLVVLGFPSNDFANQDPEKETKIASFCRLTYGVKFPMFEKTHAAKQYASPIYKVLGELAGEFPKWNFHKYVLDAEGNLVGSFPSQVAPSDKKLVSLIEKHLAEI